MPGKKKSISFDVMVKFFLQHYDIPTKKDLDKLYTRLDRLEQTIIDAASGKTGPISGKGAKRRRDTTASKIVLNVIGNAPEGIKFAEIRERTKFEEKKLRNIIFRLHKTGRIRKKARGVYIL